MRLDEPERKAKHNTPQQEGEGGGFRLKSGFFRVLKNVKNRSILPMSWNIIFYDVTGYTSLYLNVLGLRNPSFLKTKNAKCIIYTSVGRVKKFFQKIFQKCIKLDKSSMLIYIYNK